MIQGTVTPDREAVISLKVYGPKGEEEIQAVVDTGFTDDLTLPAEIIRRLGLSLRGSMPASLADGSVVTLGVYRAELDWGDKRLGILVLEADGDPLAGMSLLYGSRLLVEVVDGGLVSIESL